MKHAKLTASVEADASLRRMIQTLNEGYTEGRIDKTKLLSWIVLFFEQHDFEAQIKKIQRDHFDQIAHLKNVLRALRTAKRSGESPDVAGLLSPLVPKKQYGRRSKKIQTDSLPNKP